jgi:H+/Cl- antiporter ClcA
MCIVGASTVAIGVLTRNEISEQSMLFKILMVSLLGFSFACLIDAALNTFTQFQYYIMYKINVSATARQQRIFATIVSLIIVVILWRYITAASLGSGIDAIIDNVNQFIAKT